MNIGRVLVSAVLRSLNSALVTKGYALCHRRRRLRRSGGRGAVLAPSFPSCTAVRQSNGLGEALRPMALKPSVRGTTTVAQRPRVVKYSRSRGEVRGNFAPPAGRGQGKLCSARGAFALPGL